MAENKAFSHITVNADDDDDVVIQAGIVDDAAAEVEEDVVAVTSEPATTQPIWEKQEAIQAAAELDSPVTDDAMAANEPAPQAAPTAARPAPAADGYRETTLEDIESSKMSTVQKAVIVVALLGIVAFVVWFLVAR